MLENAYKYGFILRFKKSNASFTGFRSEPWHYRYVGKKIAKYIYENKISFEEYYAQFLNDWFFNLEYLLLYDIMLLGE